MRQVLLVLLHVQITSHSSEHLLQVGKYGQCDDISYINSECVMCDVSMTSTMCTPASCCQVCDEGYRIYTSRHT